MGFNPLPPKTRGWNPLESRYLYTMILFKSKKKSRIEKIQYGIYSAKATRESQNGSLTSNI